MRKLSGVAVFGALALAAATAPAATASTEVGDDCVAFSIAPGYTFVQLTSSAANPLPLTAPAAGVVTKWKTTLPTTTEVFPQVLKVFRGAGTNQFQVVGESAPGPATGGVNVFGTRISVQAGDRFGLSEGGKGTLYCKTENPADTMGIAKASPPVGSVQAFEPVPGYQADVVAIVEPDADNDGYGDETQDRCPQSASTQGECPTVSIDIGSAAKKKGSVVVSLTTSAEAPVTVRGVVKLGKGKKAKLNGGKKTAKPGKITRFTLKFPAKLKAALADLPRSRSLSLKITASARDLIGRVTKDQLKVKLKGQG